MAYTTPPNLRLATTVSLPGLVNLTLNEGEQYKSTQSHYIPPIKMGILREVYSKIL